MEAIRSSFMTTEARVTLCKIIFMDYIIGRI
jgi:hypothetical protein